VLTYIRPLNESIAIAYFRAQTKPVFTPAKQTYFPWTQSAPDRLKHPLGFNMEHVSTRLLSGQPNLFYRLAYAR